MHDRFSGVARVLNTASGSPYATIAVLLIIVLWAFAGPIFHFSDTWQLAMNTTSSIITFLMVFILNNAQSRDTRAINIKLDEIVRSIENADNRVIALEEKPADEAQHVVDTVKQAIEVLTEEVKTDGSPPLALK